MSAVSAELNNLALAGLHLIEASAGTGKTYSITTQYVRLLLERGLQPADILVVTYTNAAAAELRDRVRRRVRQALAVLEGTARGDDETMVVLIERLLKKGDRGRYREHIVNALRGFDEAAIFTIHGFCQRVLSEHAFESGVPFDTELVTGATDLVAQVVRDYWARELYPASSILVGSVLEQIKPADSTALVADALGHGEAAVVPEEAGVDPEKVEAQWLAAHGRAARLWVAERENVLSLLCDSGVLKKSSYPPDKIRSVWAPELDEAFACAPPNIFRRWPFLRKMTATPLKRGTLKARATPRHQFFDACDALWSAEERLRRCGLGFQIDLLDFVRHELRRRKEEANVQFFEDLLLRVDEALRGQGGRVLAQRIRSQFKAVLIDEFQDTDPVQYDIFRRVYRDTGAPLFLIGDPKQAIYAFRGADVFTYMAAKRDVGEPAPPMRTNWRSDPGLIRAVNALFENARLQFVFPEIGFHPVDPAPRASDALGGGPAGAAPFEILFVRGAAAAGKSGGPINKEWGKTQLPALVAAEIARLLSSGTELAGRPVCEGDIAVLCRTNDDARSMQKALRDLRIPSVLQTEESVFDTAEAGEVERLLRAVADPGDRPALAAALVTPVLGVNGNDLAACREDEILWEEWSRRFREWHGTWAEHGFMAAYRRVLDDSGARARLLALADGERRLTNLLHLGELLHTAAVEQCRGPLALVQWLERMRADKVARSSGVGDAAQIRLESDDAAVRVVTIHKSKGLEYPIVYCPYLWEGKSSRRGKSWVRFHDEDSDNRLTIDLGSPDQERRAKREEREALAERLRLLYVAVTRAQHQCTVVWGPFRSGDSSALGYLLHQPPAGPDDDELAQRTAARILSLDDEAMLADLSRLVDRGGGAIALRELPFERAEARASTHHPRRRLECRSMLRRLRANWRVSSFSGLAAAGGENWVSGDDGRDRDAESTHAPGEPLGPEVGPEGWTVTLDEFPGGARAGSLIHEILEKLDFQVARGEYLSRLVNEVLDRFAFGSEWSAPLCRAIGEILDTPLDEGPQALTLRRIDPTKRLHEMGFTFPVAVAATEGGGEERTGALLTASGLARTLARHGAPPAAPAYTARLAALGFAPLAGFLRGFIDLMFEWRGRWYVVDYKSNFLGPHPEDYTAVRLAEEMAGHHYFLQYYIYTLAVHRYLKLRLPGYDYDRHFGGVYYLFLRAMSPENPPGRSVFRDRPPRALIEDLSDLMGRPAAPVIEG